MPVSQNAKSLELKHLMPAWREGSCKIPVAVALTTTHCMEKEVKETTKREGKREGERKKEQLLNLNDLLTRRVLSPQVVCWE